MRLVAPSLDGDPVRCRVPSRALLGDPGRERVVALLVRSRLVTAEEETFELAHEALARAWPRLQAWLDEDVGGQRILRHLARRRRVGRARPTRRASSIAARGWTPRWSGGRRRRADLTPVERGVPGGVHVRGGVQSRALRDARQNRRLRVLLGVGRACSSWRCSPGWWRSTAATTPRGALGDPLHEALLDRSLALLETPPPRRRAARVEAYRRRPGRPAWSALLGTFTADPTFLGTPVPPRRPLAGRPPRDAPAVVALDGRG